MKKLLFLSLFLGISFVSLSQTTPWINPGAVWYFRWEDPSSGSGGNDKIEYVYDSVVYGKNCQVLTTTTSHYGQMLPGGPIQLLWTSTGARQYTYSSGDTVFYLNDTSWNVLYNFGAQPGDTWDLGMDTNYAYCSHSIVRVDSLSSINISGSPHRVLYVSDANSNSSTGIFGTIVEHIGAISYLFPLGRNCDSTVIADFYMFYFSCFSDALESYSVVAPGDCANPYHVGTVEIQSTNVFTVFPDPAESLLTIESTDDLHVIYITNLFGQLLLKKENSTRNTETIDVSSLSSGIYLISVTDRNGVRNVKRFIKK